MSNSFSSKREPQLSRENIAEMADEVRWEIQELRAGREENVLLIDALSNQWSAERILSTAQQRGKNWRFLAALADKALQAQGVGLLVAVTEATGMDVTEHLMHKSCNALERINGVYEDAVERYGENSYKAQIFEEAQQAIVNTFVQGKRLYFEQAGRLILDMLEGKS